MRGRRFALRRDTHQAFGFPVIGLAQRFNKALDLTGGEAGFLGLVARIDLYINMRAATYFVTGLSQRLNKFFAVNRFNHVKKSRSSFGLIGLQRADKTEFDFFAVVGKCLAPSGLRLLDAVLTKNYLAQIKRRLYAVVGLYFGHGDEAYVGRSPPNRPGSRSNSL